jgi:hypothetical protein
MAYGKIAGALMARLGKLPKKSPIAEKAVASLGMRKPNQRGRLARALARRRRRYETTFR